MRFLSLDLDRYGPFTGKRLAFRPDAHLHVVLGPNEAGKSCALAAVTDLLFGTKNTRYEFLHRDDGLRVGAEILARDGRTLTCFRRRGGRNTLTDRRGKSLPDDALAPFLGGLSRTVFCNAFGLDAQSLRDGAEEMLKSDGEIGTTLFAAASGLRGFRDAADELESEAGVLFTPTARKRKLNEFVKNYEDARKAARADRIGGDDWRALESGTEQAAKRLGEIAVRRKEIAEETNRLKRLKAIAPIVVLLDNVASDLDRFADLPNIEESQIAELDRAVRDYASGTQRVTEAEATLARAEADLAAIVTDDAVLPWVDTIEGLVPPGGEFSKNARDLPRVQAEADGFEADLRAVAIRLGFADVADVEARQPGDAARADLNGLLSSGRQTDAEYLRTERELARLRGELATLMRARGERAPLIDPGPLCTIHEALRPVLADLGRRDDLRSELARSEGELDKALARLNPGLAGELEKVGSALPSAETIKAHGDGIAGATRERDRLCDRFETIEAEITEVDQRMRSRQAISAVPDRESLAQLRRERDEAWVDVRAGLFDDSGGASRAELLERTADFERAGADADDLADRLIDDAQRAADQAADGRRSRDLSGERERVSAQLSKAELVLQDVLAAWRSLWLPLSNSLGSPAEMSEWRSRVEALLTRADALAERRVVLGSIISQIERVRPALDALADRLGLAELKSLDVALLNERVTERLRSIAETWDAARDGAARIAATEESIAAEETSLAAIVEAREAWRARWQSSLSACSLAPETSLDGAAAALDAWREVPGLVRERNDRRRRVAGIRRDMNAHEAEVRRVASAVEAPDDRPVRDLVSTLVTRAKAARGAAAERTARQRSCEEAIRLVKDARSVAQRADEALAELKARLTLPDVDDLAGFTSRLSERARLLGRLGDIRDELARASDGVGEAELRSGLAELHVDAIEGRLSQLASEVEQLDHEGRVTHSERDRLQADRARIEGGLGSEAATARKSVAEIDIRETARRYVVLKLGSLLLEAAIERHRAGQQDPLVKRAGTLFSSLTGGAYAGLDQTFDDRDLPILAGRRSDGRHSVSVGYMSEGTRDQLFLALRLAYLEDYAGRAEPAPFIGDDIFASFDDRRTEYGLAALAAIGSSVQPILFTHHESVAEAAQRGLGTRVDVIEL